MSILITIPANQFIGKDQLFKILINDEFSLTLRATENCKSFNYDSKFYIDTFHPLIDGVDGMNHSLNDFIFTIDRLKDSLDINNDDSIKNILKLISLTSK